MPLNGHEFATRLLAARAKQEVEANILKAIIVAMVKDRSLSKNHLKKNVCHHTFRQQLFNTKF